MQEAVLVPILAFSKQLTDLQSDCQRSVVDLMKLLFQKYSYGGIHFMLQKCQYRRKRRTGGLYLAGKASLSCVSVVIFWIWLFNVLPMWFHGAGGILPAELHYKRLICRCLAYHGPVFVIRRLATIFPTSMILYTANSSGQLWFPSEYVFNCSMKPFNKTITIFYVQLTAGWSCPFGI